MLKVKTSLLSNCFLNSSIILPLFYFQRFSEMAIFKICRILKAFNRRYAGRFSSLLHEKQK
jgi:hypothetical protein